MKRYLVYFWYVVRHKWYVLKACRKLGILWLGIIHDWSKLLPSEFFPYAITFFNADGSKKEGGFRAGGMYPKFALCHHLNRNKHHWSYWILSDGELLPIPDAYRKEMLADWIGAGLANNSPDTKAWYLKNKNELRLHQETNAWIEQQLGIVG